MKTIYLLWTPDGPIPYLTEEPANAMMADMPGARVTAATVTDEEYQHILHLLDLPAIAVA